MKRAGLIRRLTREARSAGVEFVLVREGDGHLIYRFGGQQLSIPRHREINEFTVRGILRDAGIN